MDRQRRAPQSHQKQDAPGHWKDSALPPPFHLCPTRRCQGAEYNLQPRSAALQATLDTQARGREKLGEAGLMTLPTKAAS